MCIRDRVVGSTCVGAGLCACSLLCGSSCLVHLLEHLAQSFLLCLDVVDGAGLHGSLEVGQLCLGIALDVCGQLVAVLLQHLLGLEHHLVGTVADIDLFTLLLIVGSKLFSFLHSLVDVLLGHVGGSSDGDVLLLAGAQILCADLHDAVGVDIEGDFDLRHTTGSRSDAIQVEHTQALVVAGKLTLALQHVDLNRGLVAVSYTHLSVDYQTKLYNNKTQYYRDQGCSEADARAKAATIVNPPGYSEHATGLAADLNTPEHTSLDEDFENTAAFRWLCQHAVEYGFILRYPKEAEAVTEITYEPWHWRYVGPENAALISQSGLCFEDAIAVLQKLAAGQSVTG